MIKQIYYVQEGFYSGYADTLEEAISLENRYKLYSAESGKPICATNKVINEVNNTDNTDKNFKQSIKAWCEQVRIEELVKQYEKRGRYNR